MEGALAAEVGVEDIYCGWLASVGLEAAAGSDCVAVDDAAAAVAESASSEYDEFLFGVD